MSKSLISFFILFSLFCGSLSAQNKSRYDELLSSETHASTIKVLATSMLTLQFEPVQTYNSLEKYFWYNRASGISKEIEKAKFDNSLNQVGKFIKTHKIQSLKFYGFTMVGSTDTLDLYYSANTAKGPAIIRVAIIFFDKKLPMIYSYQLIDGWKECRTTVPLVEHKSEKTMASISLSPEILRKYTGPKEF